MGKAGLEWGVAGYDCQVFQENEVVPTGGRRGWRSFRRRGWVTCLARANGQGWLFLWCWSDHLRRRQHRNIDKTNPNWRNELREQIIDDEDVTLSSPAEKQDRTNEEEEEEDEFDPELKQPVIKTVPKAEEVAEQLKDFAQFNGHEELSLALSKVRDLLHQNKLRSPKLQTTITDFFTSCWMQNFINVVYNKGDCLSNNISTVLARTSLNYLMFF